MRWTVGMKIGIGFALALLIQVVIGVVAYRSINRLITTSESVAHTHEMHNNLDDVVRAVLGAETGERGYVITGNDAYLSPYNDGLANLEQSLATLRGTKVAPTVQPQLIRLEPLAQARAALAKEVVNLRRTAGFEAARQKVISGEGVRLTTEISQLVVNIEKEENIILQQREATAQESAQKTLQVILVGVPLAVLFLTLVGFALTRDIARPLTAVTEVAEQIAAGNLSVTVPVEPRSDEVGQLTASFSRMVSSLTDTAAVTKQIAGGDLSARVTPQSPQDVMGNALAAMVQSLRTMTAEIIEGVNVLASASSEIMASTTQVASGATETAAAVSETTATVEEVKQTAQLASDKSRNVSDAAQQAVQVAQEGRKAVNDSIAGISDIQEQMEAIAGCIVRLSEQSQAIGEIIATVNDLAEQSNLLAVNAAIEAAKAGEQGKGFAVVAQEVRSLAEQSKEATAQVRTILNDIQKATNAAVMATERGNKSVDTGVRQSRTAGESIRLIGERIEDSARAALQIAASSQQQLVGMDQVAQAMENIRQASEQNVSGMKQVELTVQNLHDLGQKLKQMVSQYRI